MTDEIGIRQRLAFSTINRGEDDLDEGAAAGRPRAAQQRAAPKDRIAT
jgi:hypothetical protein